MPNARRTLRPNPVRQALSRCRPHLIAAAMFSGVANLLYLTPSIYMMQVYDRVVPTGGLVTLLAVSVIAVVGLAVISALDWLRGRVLVRLGAQVEHELAGRTLRLLTTSNVPDRTARTEGMRRFDTLRQGLSSPATLALLDAPWTPIYILVAFLLHPALGAMALAASLLLLALAWSNERATAAATRDAGEAAAMMYARHAHAAAHAAEVRALGMTDALSLRQLAEREGVNEVQAAAAFATGTHAALIKFLRLVLQSAALGLGAVLVVQGGLSAGAMLAASLLLSRALAPIEQVVGAWRQLQGLHGAYAGLVALFDGEEDTTRTWLPDPTGAIAVERLTVATPQGDRVALADVSVEIAAGEIIGLAGASGAGKSSLLCALAGGDRVARGTVRFDGAAFQDWDREQLSRHIGYLPQSFVLFAGTVKENIARFALAGAEDRGRIDAMVVAAAKAAHAHDMIVRLPNGYDTPIGVGGVGLSAGQTQRVAIARALYGDPRILLLDEPTAHLDAEAAHAVVKTLSRLRVAGHTVIFATHSGDLLASADKILVLRDGRVERFAPLASATPALTNPISHTIRKTA